jgi:hypothetical protein
MLKTFIFYQYMADDIRMALPAVIGLASYLNNGPLAGPHSLTGGSKRGRSYGKRTTLQRLPCQTEAITH